MIEYYLALITVFNSDSNLISYDDRRRDVFLEEDRIQMMSKIHQLISVIDSIDNDVEITGVRHHSLQVHVIKTNV